MAKKTPIVVLQPGDSDRHVGWNEEYDVIEHGYRTPDGLEHFGSIPTPAYLSDKTDLSTQKGQDFAQSKFEKAVRATGVTYDPAVHGKLEFILRVRQVRFTGVVPLFPNSEPSSELVD